MISNGLVALSGALTAQYQGFSDASMGTGVVVMGLAAVIIGASIFKKMSFMKYTTISIFGAIIYKLAIALALKFGLNPNYLKLMTAVIVIIALSLNSGVFKFKGKRRKAKSTEIKREGGDVNAKDSSIAQSL